MLYPDILKDAGQKDAGQFYTIAAPPGPAIID
jgi:hypothetical protein